MVSISRSKAVRPLLSLLLYSSFYDAAFAQMSTITTETVYTTVRSTNVITIGATGCPKSGLNRATRGPANRGEASRGTAAGTSGVLPGSSVSGSTNSGATTTDQALQVRVENEGGSGSYWGVGPRDRSYRCRTDAVRLGCILYRLVGCTAELVVCYQTDRSEGCDRSLL